MNAHVASPSTGNAWLQHYWGQVRGTLPGIFLTAAIAAGAVALHDRPGFGSLSPMIIAIVLGIAFHNLIGTPARAKAGVTFSLRRILRFAIVLLGLQITIQQAAEVGVSGIAIVATALISSFAFTTWLGRLIGVDRKLAELIAAGTSICGASAVIATNTVTEAHDEDVAYAVACVTVFGSLAMVVYPVFAGVLHLSPRAFGLWAGSSIHEIAQVVAAAFQGGPEAGHLATIAKLTRVAMLAPLVISLGIWRRYERRGHASAHRVPLPWFVLGFVALAVLNSLVSLPAPFLHETATITTFLLSTALAAMGLETDIGKLRAKGLRPLLLGFAAFLFIGGFSLMLVEIAS